MGKLRTLARQKAKEMARKSHRSFAQVWAEMKTKPRQMPKGGK